MKKILILFSFFLVFISSTYAFNYGWQNDNYIINQPNSTVINNITNNFYNISGNNNYTTSISFSNLADLFTLTLQRIGMSDLTSTFNIGYKANITWIKNYYGNKTYNDARYLQSFTESDPIWNSQKNNYYNISTDYSNDTKTISKLGGWNASSGKVYLSNTSANVGIGVTSPGAKSHIKISSATSIGQIVQSASSQSADLSEWKNLSDIFSRIDANGFFRTYKNGIYFDTIPTVSSSNTIYSYASGGNYIPLLSYNVYNAVVFGSSSASSMTFLISGGSNRMSFQSGGVGIFMTTPTALLEVTDNSGGVSDYFKISSNSTSNGNKFIVKNTGYVGIGTTSPSGKLDIHGAGTTTGVNAQFSDSTGSAKVTILDNGKVGIGTVSPSQLLDVNGNVSIRDSYCLWMNGSKYLCRTQGNTKFSGEYLENLYFGKGSGTSDNLNSFGGNLGIGQFTLDALVSKGDGVNPRYNVCIGDRACTNLKNGSGNIAIGFSALGTATTGDYSIAIGNNVLAALTTGAGNIGIGSDILQLIKTQNANTVIGSGAGQRLNGSYNTILGWGSGVGGTGSWGANSNTLIGYQSGVLNFNGARNSMLGDNTMRYNKNGSDNTALGYNACKGTAINNYNKDTCLGSYAGDNIINATQSIVIGYGVHLPNPQGKYQLNIGNFIYGTNINGTGDVMSNGKIGIGVTSPTRTLDVRGSINSTGNLTISRVGIGTNSYSLIDGYALYVNGKTFLNGNLTIDGSGLTKFSGGAGLPYGSMGIDDGSITVTVGATNTEYAVPTGLVNGTLNQFTFSGSNLTASIAGVYSVSWSMSLHTASANQILEGGLMVNSVAKTIGNNDNEEITANRDVSVSGNALLKLNAGDKIRLYVEDDTSATNIIVTHASLTAIMVGS